jgi:hypothetical protein
MRDAPGLFSAPEQTGAETLHAMACGYARWAEGDYRSALLRAAGLNETVLKFGMVRLWLDRAKAVDLSVQSGMNSKGEPNYQSIPHEELDVRQRNAFERRIAMVHGASQMANLLGSKRGWLKLKPLDRKYNDDLPKTDLRLRRKKGVAPVEPVNQPLSAHDLAGIRNKAIHFTVPVGEELASTA